MRLLNVISILVEKSGCLNSITASIEVALSRSVYRVNGESLPLHCKKCLLHSSDQYTDNSKFFYGSGSWYRPRRDRKLRLKKRSSM